MVYEKLRNLIKIIGTNKTQERLKDTISIHKNKLYFYAISTNNLKTKENNIKMKYV